MQGPWFHCADLSPDLIALDDAEAAHAAASRRLVPGDRCVLFDGRGGLADCEIVDAAGRAAGRRSDREFRVAVRARTRVDHPPAGLRLVVAAPKKDRLEWLVEKCTELGASQITLTEYDRSIVHPGGGKFDRLARTAVEACKQSRRAWLPIIDGPVPFDAALTADRPPGAAAFADADGDSTLSDWLRESAASVCLFIGPEGGFSDRERSAFAAQRMPAVRLGPGILRIETAAIAAAAVWSEGRRA
ncbi:MAG: 16S rRNA (uracil(1498)-N(3))-methyltransferase [Phycisphaerales bacterium]|nr:16S rRNA (uracil(1498)-N(3))-methyltransferase [Phycisphaerales bacterium]